MIINIFFLLSVNCSLHFFELADNNELLTMMIFRPMLSNVIMCSVPCQVPIMLSIIGILGLMYSRKQFNNDPVEANPSFKLCFKSIY